MIRYGIPFVLVLCAMGMFACENILVSLPVHVILPDIRHATSWKENNWVVYYIHADGTIHSKTIHNSNSTIVRVRKMGSMPVVGCIDIPFEREDICAFQVGAIYPYDYDVTKQSMNLLPHETAEAASIALDFYSRGVNLDLLNTYKLYTAIVSRAKKAPIYKDLLLRDITNNNISIRSIKSKKKKPVPLPKITHQWINTLWGQSDISLKQKEITVFYPGRWLFIQQNSNGVYNIFAWISVDANGIYHLHHFE